MKSVLIAGSLCIALSAAPAVAATVVSAPPYPPSPAETIALSGFGGTSLGFGLSDVTATEMEFMGGESLALDSGDPNLIQPTDGAFYYLRMEVVTPHRGWEDLEFRILMGGAGPVGILLENEFGQFYHATFDLGAGSHLFHAVAAQGEAITRVQIGNYPSEVMTGVEPLRADFKRTFTMVPEPSTWSMLILGFAAAGGALRAGRSRQGPATKAA